MSDDRPHPGRPAGRTRRQQLADLLAEGPDTVRGLAARVRLPVKTVAEELEHVRRSLRGRRLVVEPAQCLSCGLVMSRRQRLTAPSRCPRCRSERTTEPLLRIE